MIQNQDILNHSNSTSLSWWHILLLEYVTTSIEYRMLVPSLSTCKCGFNPRAVHWPLLTYSMEQSPSWEANWFAASQEIPSVLWNPKVPHRNHKRPPRIPILSQPNLVLTPTSHFLKIHPNIILTVHGPLVAKNIVSGTSLFGRTSTFSCQCYFTSTLCLFIRLSTKCCNLTASLNISLITN
jgi:hypothetical protein